MVLGALPGRAARAGGAGRSARPRWPSTRRCARPSTRSRGWPPPRASTRTSPRAGPSGWPAVPPSSPGPGPRSTRPATGAAARTTCGCSTPTAAGEVVRAGGVDGATYTPDCAAIHPARLVRGLARAAERRGVTIHERTRVTSIAPREVRTEHGVVRAGTVVRATEGFTPQLPGHRRTSIPVYSLVIATEPLPASTWDEIGLARRETFSDFRHLHRLRPAHRRRPDRLRRPRRAVPRGLAHRAAVRPR